MDLPDLHPDQIPPFVVNDEDLLRWELVVATTLVIAHRFDLQFARELYFGDIPTGSMTPDAQSQQS